MSFTNLLIDYKPVGARLAREGDLTDNKNHAVKDARPVHTAQDR
jgi:hypothetical protein